MDKNKPYYLGMYEKAMPNSLSLLEKLKFVKESGFDHLEISIDESDDKLKRLDWTLEEINELKKAIIDTGIPIRTMCLSGHRKYPLGSNDEKIVERSLEICDKAIRLASYLGIRIIQIAGYDVYYEKGSLETKKRFIENLNKFVLMAAKEGIYLGFETMETPFMDTVEKAMEYVKIINSPYLNVFPDIGNLKNASLIYGNSVNCDIKKGSGHLIACHLKETIPNHYREIPFGTGHSEYLENLKVLKEEGVRLFTGEFWYVGQDDWKQVCFEANKFLRSKLDQVYK